MASDMDWTVDYCLFCDKQTAQGAYCSQACRLADLEKAGMTDSTTSGSPSQGADASWQFARAGGNYPQVSQFQLQPAVNFAAYRSSSTRSTESPPTSPSGLPHQPTYVPPTMTARTYSDYHQKPRMLNTSSSRSSLSSIASTTNGLSDQALSQLRSYSESFDHTRDWKRRRTLG